MRKGSKLTPEQRQLIKDGIKAKWPDGRKLTDEDKANKSAARMGWKPSEETKRKMSEAKKNNPAFIAMVTERIKQIRPTKESLAAHYESIRGEGNPSKRAEVREKISDNRKAVWSKMERTDQKLRHGLEVKRWRMKVLVRDDFTCQLCGEKNYHMDRLVADHIKPFSLYPDLIADMNNGRTLCKPCHLKTKTYGTRALFPKEE